jgi:hypothetical protein
LKFASGTFFFGNPSRSLRWKSSRKGCARNRQRRKRTWEGAASRICSIYVDQHFTGKSKFLFEGVVVIKELEEF